MSAAATIAAATAAIQLGKAGVQAYQAHQLSKEKRPVYEIPSYLKESTELSKYIASLQEAPGSFAAKREVNKAISEGATRSLEYSDNPNKAIFQAGLMQEKKLDALTNIRAQDAVSQRFAMQQYMQNLDKMAGEQKLEFDYNKAKPYASAKAAESALREGSYRNLLSGVQQGANALDLFTGGIEDKKETNKSGGIDAMIGAVGGGFMPSDIAANNATSSVNNATSSVQNPNSLWSQKNNPTGFDIDSFLDEQSIYAPSPIKTKTPMMKYDPNMFTDPNVFSDPWR